VAGDIHPASQSTLRAVCTQPVRPLKGSDVPSVGPPQPVVQDGRRLGRYGFVYEVRSDARGRALGAGGAGTDADRSVRLISLDRCDATVSIARIPPTKETIKAPVTSLVLRCEMATELDIFTNLGHGICVPRWKSL